MDYSVLVPVLTAASVYLAAFGSGYDPALWKRLRYLRRSNVTSRPWWRRILRKVGGVVPRKAATRFLRVEDLLREAGMDWKLQEFLGLEIVCGVVGSLTYLATGGFSLALAILGWFIPVLWVRAVKDHYHAQIQRELPAVLDILVVAAEAGLSLGNCLQSVVGIASPGAAVGELKKLLSEIQVGKTSTEALRDMADRVNQPDLRSFALTMIQAQSLGTSSAQVLRVLASQMRAKRAQRAETAALKAPVKMVFPLVFFIFPALLIVFLGPVFLRGSVL